MFKHVEDIELFVRISHLENIANFAQQQSPMCEPAGFTLVANGGPEPLTAGTIGGLACEATYQVTIHYDSPVQVVS